MISMLTGQDNAELLEDLSPMKISDDWQKSLSIDVGNDFRRLSKIEYWMCPKTKFCWYAPQEAAGGEELYKQLQKFDWYYMPDKWEFNMALSLLPAGCSILEIGVGRGHFLQFAKKRGYFAQGVELNSLGASQARSLGFQVHELMLDDIAQKTSTRFDAICSFQVLEHVPDPRKFFDGMLSLLKPGGKLILSVPNAAVLRKVDPRNLSLLNQPPHHMSHWDEGIFRALEEYFPVKVTSVHHEPLATHHLAWMVSGYLKNFLSPLGERITRLIVNRYTILPIQWMTRIGIRRFVPGHTLLVELEYLNN
jgi:2-polyprenyl-3-methyl-5-hydroxy-6-metoxy-1,4-benzoquinol methylase